MANNAQLAHVWAQQRRPEGEGSSFFFDGPIIYSFGRHFPIARFTDRMLNGSRVVLFTIENGWGGYIGRHINHARNALRGLNVEIIECLEPAARNGSHNTRQLSEEEQHAANLADYSERYLAALKAAALARKNGPWHIGRAEHMRETCRRYCEAFELVTPEWVNEAAPADLAEIRAAVKKRAEDEAARQREKLAQNVADWRAGKRAELDYNYPDTLLRLSANGARVQTSRGAEVPVKDARRLWLLVARCVASGKAYKVPPSAPVAVGAFELREIRADGLCIVGCHTLHLAETRAFAVAQGWAA